MSIVSIVSNNQNLLLVPRGLPGATGPAGAQGPAGEPGAPGGRTILNGAGAPSGATGADGDFYIDTAADAIYGPKTAGAWGSATSLIGPQGATGPQGPAGPAGAAGATGPAGPQGETGPQGPAGPAGADGAPGITDTFTSSAAGLVPASGGGTTNFLRADGTFAAPPSGSMTGAEIAIALNGETLSLRKLQLEAASLPTGYSVEFLSGFLTTTDASDVAALTLPVAESEVVGVRFVATAVHAGAAAGGHRQILACAMREPAGSTVASTASTSGSAIVGGSSISTNVAASGNDFLVRVRGVAATTVKWHWTAEVTRLKP